MSAGRTYISRDEKRGPFANLKRELHKQDMQRAASLRSRKGA